MRHAPRGQSRRRAATARLIASVFVSRARRGRLEVAHRVQQAHTNLHQDQKRAHHAQQTLTVQQGAPIASATQVIQALVELDHARAVQQGATKARRDPPTAQAARLENTRPQVQPFL